MRRLLITILFFLSTLGVNAFAGYGQKVYMKGTLEGMTKEFVDLRTSDGKVFRISRKNLKEKFDTRPLSKLSLAVLRKDISPVTRRPSND
jgi:hypothetical protein